MAQQVYGVSTYNADGYWLLLEEYLDGDAIAVATASSPDIYMTLNLFGDAFAVSSGTGDVTLVMPVEIVLSSNSISSSNNLFGINFTLLMQGNNATSALGILQSNIVRATTGSSLSSSTGNVAKSNDIPLTPVIATSASGTVAFTANTALTSVLTSTSLATIFSVIDKSLTGTLVTSTVGSVDKSFAVEAPSNLLTASSGTIISNMRKAVTAAPVITSSRGSVGSINDRQITPVTISAINNYINSSRSLSLYANSTTISSGTILYGHILPHRLDIILDKEYRIAAVLDRE